MNVYWQAVVQEVLNKDDPNYPIRFTNMREQSVPQAMHRVQKKRVRYTLDAPFKNSYLTHQEAVCVLHRIMGTSYSKIAKSIGLKSRTVAYYFKNIRDKLQCETTLEVIGKIGRSQFFKKYYLKNNKIQMRTEA